MYINIYIYTYIYIYIYIYGIHIYIYIYIPLKHILQKTKTKTFSNGMQNLELKVKIDKITFNISQKHENNQFVYCNCILSIVYCKIEPFA